jgi:PhnB protein
MVKIDPYIIFNGNCETAFNHYKSVFGTEFSMFSRYSDMPSQEGQELPGEFKSQIMHVELPMGKETVLMGSDAGPGAPPTVVGNNFSISISAGSKTRADHYFENLSEGGRVNMPMEKTFWGSYFGMCTDKFGINWMISFSEAPQG